MAQPGQKTKDPITIRKVLGGKHILVAIVFMALGFIIKLLPMAFHLEGTGWEMIEELGTFIALVIAVHLLYEIFIKREEHQVFIEEMSVELNSKLENFANTTITSIHESLQHSIRTIQSLEDFSKTTITFFHLPAHHTGTFEY